MIFRRNFLLLAAAAAFFPRQKAPDLILRSIRPEDFEMPLAGFSDFITPVERFFVRSHVTLPKVDIAVWRLKIEGHVATPVTLTMEEIRRLPSVELTSVLECAGNGRAFFDPPVAGLQWENGAVGNGRWRGVRLAALLQHAGVKSGAVEVLFDGADVPIGGMADFQRSIPLQKALDPNTILAYDMNGGQLPVRHGYPLRAIVPGWAGDSWTKWVTTVRVLNETATGYWMKSAYLFPRKSASPGAVVAADAMSPVTSLRVKSVIAFPENGARVEAGKAIVVRGAAWSGDRGPVTAVDISVDRGSSWRPARLAGEQTPFGWRLWEYSWTPMNDGFHTVLARARDASGDTQPVLPEWNPSGYLWNAIARVDLNTAGQSSKPIAPETASAPPVFRDSCLECHEDDVVRQQRLTRAQWDRELNKMIGWGADVPAENREALLDFLASLPKPRP